MIDDLVEELEALLAPSEAAYREKTSLEFSYYQFEHELERLREETEFQGARLRAFFY
jgi:hypothetical protein